MLGCRSASPGRKSKQAALGGLAAMLLTAFAFWGVGNTLDMSPDGQSAHLAGAHLLANGWNPIRDPGFERADEILPKDYPLRDAVGAAFAQGYHAKAAAKGVYYRAASAVVFFGDFDIGRGFNLLAIAAAFLLAAAAASLLGLSPFWSAAVGAAAALNPVAVNQALSSYVDGQLAMLLTSLLALGVILARSKSRLATAGFGAAMILAIGAKLTGFFYAGFLGFCVVLFLRRWTGAYRAAWTFVAASAVGTLLVGYSPIVSNMINDGRPFRYLRNVVIWENPLVERHDRLTKLAISLFSETDAKLAAPQLKAPFAITRSEWRDLRQVTDAGARIGGFGPWMGGLIASSAAIAALAAVRRLRGRGVLLVAVAIIIGSALANPEAWRAHLSPQIWLVPLAVALFGLLQKPTSDIAVFARALCVAVLLNAGFVAFKSVYRQANYQMAANGILDVMADLDRRLTVDLGNSRINQILLRNRGIAFREVDDIKACPAAFRTPDLNVEVCVLPRDERATAALREVEAYEARLRRAGAAYPLILSGR